ncbi:MAG TPA: leucyl aminopeptidase family protein [Jatrophihabitantaceae bacterium]|nr:leucyl aminopeptidase family protein [Jatrophihabitantaceae bacterium]
MIEVRLAAAGASAEPVTETASSTALRKAGGKLARDLGPGRTVLSRPGLSGDRLAAFVEGLALGGYRYTLATTAPPPNRTVELADVSDSAAIEAGLQAAAATAWARDLANTPSSVKTPTWLGQQAAAELAPLGVDVAVHDVEWLTEHGFGGVLAVGAGSAAPPCLIQATWRPRGAAAAPHVVLVGKGITFDTGGLNIKPGEGMKTMKTDMSGGAAVLAALRLIAASHTPVRVTALVPTAENSFGASSYRPGDVLRHVGGRTSEIANTDAEGRIVLADALAYAAARLRPSVLVDVATLTGAMKVALGMQTGGVFATTDELAAALITAGDAAGEPLWRMPLVADYESALDSDVADANNAPGNPGAITAALFLQHFTGGLPWAHLDIAGPARATKDDGMFTKGATGFGARLLAGWVQSLR